MSDESTVPSVPVDIRNAALTILAGLAVVLMLQYAQTVLIPVVMGLLVSYALDPAVGALARRRLPRPIGAALVLMALLGGGGALIYGLRGEVRDVIEQLPVAAHRLRTALETQRPRTATAMQQVQKAANELEQAATTATAAPPPAPSGVQKVQIEPPAFNVSDYMMSGSVSVAAGVGQFVLVTFLVYFLLASGDLYRRKLVKIVGPSLSKKKITLQILSDIDRQIELFLVVQVFTSAVVAAATWLAFRWLGLQQAGLWGLLAGVFNSIPYFGPVLVTAATTAVGFMQFSSIRMAIVVGLASLAITSVEGFLLTPLLTSRAARMNAVAVFVGLLFWGWIWNVWGMLLAVPMLMVLKAVGDHVEDFKAIGELLGE